MTRPSNTSSGLASAGTRVLRRLAGALAALGATAMLAFPAQAGTIVVNGDEWTLSDSGYSLAGASNADTFAQNLIAFLDGDGVAGGNALIYSTNFGLTGSNLNTSLTSAGYAVTTSTATTFDLTTLMGYDAIFLGGGGFAKDDAVLAAYVNAGGGVYIAAGTGFGGAAGEAALWNGFLTEFGLELGTVYNGVAGNQPAGTGPLFDGVTQLYFDNANTVYANPAEAGSSIRMSTAAGIGLIGVYRSGTAPPPPPNGVPLPGTIALLGIGLGLAGVSLRRRNA